jgi:hypothetical protein
MFIIDLVKVPFHKELMAAAGFVPSSADVAAVMAACKMSTNINPAEHSI